jgi:hypothetical protein
MTPTTVLLRRAYAASPLSLGQVAAQAEVSERTVWAVLNGHNVRTRSFFAVCRVLGVATVPVPGDSAGTCEIAS